MKPAPFELLRPATVDEAWHSSSSTGGDAKPLRAARASLPAMNLPARARVLVDLIGFRAGVRAGRSGGLAVGAMDAAAGRGAERVVARAAPLLAKPCPRLRTHRSEPAAPWAAASRTADPSSPELPA